MKVCDGAGKLVTTAVSEGIPADRLAGSVGAELDIEAPWY
jgi:hypothetical protein